MDFACTWITVLLWIVLLQKPVRFVTGQGCNPASDFAPCADRQICTNGTCEPVVGCTGNVDCSGTPGTVCVADFCQQEKCTATGQCVTGQKCSQNVDVPQCVYPVILNVEESTEVVLSFTEPGSGGPYEGITWYKNQTGSSTYRIVFVHPLATGGEPKYYNEYCSGNSPCDTSTKGELNVGTGLMTIHSVNISDEGFYYYDFYIDDGSADTGHKYEIHMKVHVTPKKEDLTLTGITGVYEEVGTELELTCMVSRIRPEAAQMYWKIGERIDNGSDVRTGLNDDGTFNQMITLMYTVAREDEGKTIECVVVSANGTTVSNGQIVNPGYGPSGKPNVVPDSSSKHAGQKVNLTCNNPEEDGNPDCGNYTWNRIEGSDGIPLPTTKMLTFIMRESWAGNYTCTCGNDYNTSGLSNVAEVIFKTGPAPTPTPTAASSGVNMAIIGGAVGGAVFVILIVVIAIFLMRRRKKPPKAQPAEPVYAEMQQTSHSDDELGRSPQRNGSAEPLYAQPSKRKLRPHRGIDHGPQYENAEKLRKENPYENTKIDNNNPPSKQENGNPDGVVYTEVNIGKDGKPRPKERNSIKKKVHQQEEPTVYAEIVPGGKSGETK